MQVIVVTAVSVSLFCCVSVSSSARPLCRGRCPTHSSSGPALPLSPTRALSSLAAQSVVLMLWLLFLSLALAAFRGCQSVMLPVSCARPHLCLVFSCPLFSVLSESGCFCPRVLVLSSAAWV